MTFYAAFNLILNFGFNIIVYNTPLTDGRRKQASDFLFEID